MTRRATSMPDSVRRRLLRLGGYVPPAILGVMMAPGLTEAAKPGQTKKCCGTVIVISAGGNACCPCVPTCPNGMPNPKYNPNKCFRERCEMGNCAACAQACWRRKKKCKKESQKGGCACTCVKVGPCWKCI